MEALAAVSLHHHHHVVALPASLPPPSHHHHHCRTLPVPAPHTTRCPPSVSASSSKSPAAAACVTLHARSAQALHPAVAHHSSRAATGYAAALADACVRAGTLRRASRHARALSRRQISSSSSQGQEEELDARVAALVRMLVGKGKAGMVAEVMAEFAAICDHLLPRARYQGCH